MRNWLIIFLIAGLISTWGCQPASKDKQESQRELKVAVAAPFTGNAAAFGEMIKRGAELREKEINEAGGINGMKLTLLFEDDAGKGSEASLVAERIANNLQILAVVGHFNSTCSLAGKPIYQRAGIVELSPGSTAVNVCEGSDWTFRNLYRDDFQGQFIARYLNEIMTVRSVAVFFDNDDYGRGLRNAFAAEAERIGLDLVASEAYDRDNTDFKAQLTSIKSKNPDAIFVSGLYSEAGLIIKQARETGITAQFFGADGVDSPDFLIIAGASAEGAHLATPFTFGAAGGEDALQMATNFEELHGVAPDTWAALTYDAVGMIAEALEKTYNPEATIAENRKAIRDHLASLDTPEEGYKGVTGLTYFDRNGDTVNKPAYVKIVKDGEFVAADQQLLELE